ncbi:uncharacterized protein LOC129618868 [Condylostylus longicornis]|uniref:uncharacterized protein LOC129618868 n=1 Tax=Condylostylus longicornis TaxID=2530218 RepID=UPI00244DE7AA|nr:uncharacterized protein LOC129618868 [Condylostylus longicornis]
MLMCNYIKLKIHLTKNTVFFLFLLKSLALIEGGSDWLQDCEPCHCHWNSGKKTADCKNRTFSKIPTIFNGELQVIDLSLNQIPEIRREEFFDASLQNLHKIYMKNCTLQEISRDSFKGLAVLFELDLSNNYIRALPVGTFASLQRLRNLIMNNNEIEVLENRLFDNMKYLIRVEFKHNRIKKIEMNVFINVESLQLIYLESNRLSFLRKETFENITKLVDLTLAYNPWNCTCELQPFRDFSIARNLYTPPTDCYEPTHLKGKLWTEVPTEHFACKPKIIQPRTQSYIEATEENVTIVCRIRGIPKPDVFWLFNKRPLNTNEQRIQIRSALETFKKDYDHVLVSELTIIGLKSSDRGTYTCMTENRGGKDEVDIILALNVDKLIAGVPNTDSTSNLLLIICLVAITLLLLLIVIVLVLCWYCRKVRHYSKEATMSENGLITSKFEKPQNGSVLEGSVIMELQKSLLTEVNPVEKPPRRTELENIDGDDIHEIEKTLLYETPFASHDEETNSVTLSDTTPRSRATYVDDGCGANLPPDLLSFSAQRVPQSPSLQSSISNIPTDNRPTYRKSPLSSPVYQHVLPSCSLPSTSSSLPASNGIYGTAQTQFRTLQYPKNRNFTIVTANTSNTNRNNESPFIPAPVVYPPIIMKQGYMTIPRKPRVPSWTPSVTSPLSEFQPASITQNPSIAGTDMSEASLTEPVYDNLGLRTTAGGNSMLSLHKIGTTNANSNKVMSPRYTMKDRPLPATPNTINNECANTNFGVTINVVSNSNSGLKFNKADTSNNGAVNHNFNKSISNNNNNSNSNNNNNNSNSNNNNKNNNNNNNNSLLNNSSNFVPQSTSKLYEPIHELSNLTNTSDTEPLYGTAKSNSGLTIVPSINNGYQNATKSAKIPPRPPPKPKKKIAVTSTGHGGSTSQLFQDEDEDGTEV